MKRLADVDVENVTKQDMKRFKKMFELVKEAYLFVDHGRVCDNDWKVQSRILAKDDSVEQEPEHVSEEEVEVESEAVVLDLEKFFLSDFKPLKRRRLG